MSQLLFFEASTMGETPTDPKFYTNHKKYLQDIYSNKEKEKIKVSCQSMITKQGL
jgi:hypothetical protein